ncbi:hypothetical protein RFI_36054, partial [Reticulomyxa filosa]
CHLVVKNKMREVLTIEVGQAGIQLENAICEQYCAKHAIDNGGKRNENAGKDDPFKVFFEEAGSGQFPYDTAVDLELNAIDDVRNGPFVAISLPECLVHGKEDLANKFARGHYTIGKQIIDEVNDRLRKLVDNCDNGTGFVIGHSAGGGTGSGLGALKPYNALLERHWLLDRKEVSLLLDNEAIYGICQKQLRIAKPDIDNLNKLISKVISAILRLCDLAVIRRILNELQTNLVPFPSLHFMTTGMSPIIPKVDVSTAPNDIQKITDYKHMAISLNYRGFKIKRSKRNGPMVETNNKIMLVEWCPTGLKIDLNEVPAALESNGIGAFNKNVVMIANNTGISRVFSKRMPKSMVLCTPKERGELVRRKGIEIIRWLMNNQLTMWELQTLATQVKIKTLFVSEVVQTKLY